MYAWVHAYINVVCMYIYMYYVLLYVDMYVYMNTYRNVQPSIHYHLCIYTCISVHINVCMYVCMCMYHISTPASLYTYVTCQGAHDCYMANMSCTAIMLKVHINTTLLHKSTKHNQNAISN